jgi:hypothetical protein
VGFRNATCRSQFHSVGVKHWYKTRSDYSVRTGLFSCPQWYGHNWVEFMLWPTDSRPISLGVGHRFETHDEILLFPFFCRTIALLFVLGRPLWREDWSVICSAICQWSESRRTHNQTLLSYLRLLGSLSVASYDSQGLRWKSSNPPPHGSKRVLLNAVMNLRGP